MAVRTLVLLALMTWAGSAPALAQDPAPPGEPLDRVVAVVGDSAILQSDIELALVQMAAQSGRELPEDPTVLERLRQQALQQEIEQLLLIQAADQDSVVVADAEIEARVDEYMGQQRRSFGSETAFHQAIRSSGTTVEGFRETIEQEIRANAIIQRYMARVQQRRSAPPVTEEEIRRFFDEQRDQLGERPATIAFSQVVVAPKPADSAHQAALDLARDLLSQLRDGADFGRLARQYSDDPGSSNQGGDLGWFRPERMVPAFADAVRSLRPGQTSGVVESTFGFHIIRLEKVRSAERQARHILIQPEITDADRQRAHALADSLVAAAQAGAPMDSLMEAHGDPTEQASVGPAQRDALPAPYGTALAGAGEGDVIGPVELSDGQGGSKWAVVRVTDVTEAGEYTLDDVRGRIRDNLQQQKLIDELLEELREKMYVDIRI